MRIVTKVKGEDDYGRVKLYGNVYQYGHSYPRVEKGDFILYYSPTENSLGIYQVKEETEYYFKDGYQYCEGNMIRFKKAPMDFINLIEKTDPSLAMVFINTIENLIEKHSNK